MLKAYGSRATQLGRTAWRKIQEFTQRVVKKIQCWIEAVLHAMQLFIKGSAAVVAAVCAAIVLLFVGITVFIMLCFASAATARFLLLHNVPGSTVLDLSYTVLPLVTEQWRGRAIDEYIGLSFSQPAVANSSNKQIALTSNLLTEKAADLKLSILKQYTDNLVASSTLILPSVLKSEMLFAPSGEPNYDHLFSSSSDPLFLLDQEYAGTVQLVFLKEEVGCDTALVLQYSILYSTEDEWSLPSLKVLFSSTHTVNVRTGPHERRLIRTLWNMMIEFFFYIPLKVHRFLYYFALDYVNAPFPNIDHRREIAVLVPLYDHFTPPSPLRDHLRAVNFTLFQQLGEQDRRKVRISRWMFHSSVHLHGLPSWLREYPFLSFMVLTLLFGVGYCFGTLILAGWGALYFFYFSKQEKSSYTGRPKYVTDRDLPHTDSTTSSSTASTPRRRSTQDFTVPHRPQYHEVPSDTDSSHAASEEERDAAGSSQQG